MAGFGGGGGGSWGGTSGGNIYAGGKTTYVPDKNTFYSLVANSGLPAQEFANNPFGVSLQEIQGMVGTGGQQQGTTSGGSYSSGGGGGGASNAQAAANAAANAELDAQLGRLPNQLNAANQNVLNAYQGAYNTLANQKTAEEDKYKQTTATTKKDYQGSVGSIKSSTGQGLTGIQRLLGSRGAGNSSAATTLAPYAAGLVGQQQLSGVNDSFNNNITGLNNAWEDTKRQFNNSFGSLEADKNSKLNANTVQSNNARASLLAQKSAPDINQIHALQAQIDALGVNPNFTPQTVAPRAVTLSDYAYTPAGAPQVANSANPNIAQQTGAFYNLVGDPNKKQQSTTTGVAPQGATA